MNTQHVVVLVGSNIDPNSLLRTGGDRPLGGYIGPVTVIASRTSSESCVFPIHQVTTHSSPVDRISTCLGFAALGRILTRSPVGRLVNSLSPSDQSRVFHRAITRDPEATRLIANASLLIAADLPAVRTAWAQLHSEIVPRAVYTLAAAMRELSAS